MSPSRFWLLRLVRVAWLPHADDVPLLGCHGTSIVAGESTDTKVEAFELLSDRPRSSFHRLPAKGDDFPKTGCLPPPRPALEKIAPLLHSESASCSRRLDEALRASPQVSPWRVFRSACAFGTRGDYRAWD